MPQTEEQLTKAERLVSAARTLAVASYVPTSERFPGINSIPAARWDHVVTIASLFVAVSQLNHEVLPEESKNNIRGMVTRSACEWDARAFDVFQDCTDFVDRNCDSLKDLPTYRREPQFLMYDALGFWVVWNLFDHAPRTDEEQALVRVLGGIVIHSFVGWWH